MEILDVNWDIFYEMIWFNLVLLIVFYAVAWFICWEFLGKANENEADLIWKRKSRNILFKFLKIFWSCGIWLAFNFTYYRESLFVNSNHKHTVQEFGGKHIYNGLHEEEIPIGSPHPVYHFERTVFTNTLKTMLTIWTIRHSLLMLYRFFKIYYPHLVYFEDSTLFNDEIEEDENDDSNYENAGTPSRQPNVESNEEYEETYRSSILMSVRHGYQYQYRSQNQNFFTTSVDIEDSALWLFPMFGLFVRKAVATWVVCIPFICILSHTQPTQISTLDYFGMMLYSAGFLIEFLADTQLLFFKLYARAGYSSTTRTSYVNDVLKTGLWKYCRHPNYFGNVLLFAGMYLWCFNHMFNSLTILSLGSFALFLYMVYRETSSMESLVSKTIPGYSFYASETTSLILPWPRNTPKRKPAKNNT